MFKYRKLRAVCDCNRLCERIYQTGGHLPCSEIQEIVQEILDKNLDNEKD